MHNTYTIFLFLEYYFFCSLVFSMHHLMSILTQNNRVLLFLSFVVMISPNVKPFLLFEEWNSWRIRSTDGVVTLGDVSRQSAAVAAAVERIAARDFILRLCAYLWTSTCM